MALTKDKKQDIVGELATLLDSSKMTVVAKYQGTTVKSMQQLRKNAEDNGTVIKVVKNRLVIKALSANDTYSSADTSGLKGMLMYAFNSSDEVAPAQVIHNMTKAEPQLEFVCAYDGEGNFLSAAEVQALAQLPSREELIAGVINTLQSPVRNVLNALGGNLHGMLDAVAAQKA